MARFTPRIGLPQIPVRYVRGLRFRLTVSYVLFFVVLLSGIGLFFRETLSSLLQGEVQDALEEEWGSAKAYLKVENQRPEFVPDPSDEDEALAVARIKEIYLLTDTTGLVLGNSETYASIGIDPPAEVKRILALPQGEIRVRYDSDGVPYLVKAGRLPDEHKQLYFFALGRSLEAPYRTVNTFTRQYFLLMLPMVTLACIIGWVLSGRALQPVQSVAETAQAITSSNLSSAIPLRGAGDELDHLIDSFNRMTARLSQSFEQIRRFSTDVSHELRTPLTAIRGQLEVALLTANRPEQYHEAILNALEDVEQLSSIVRALMLLSQAESGQLALQKTSFDLGQLASDMVDQFQIPAEEKNLKLKVHSAPDLVIHADRVQIERLISNLMSNAVKYTPDGGTVSVRCGASQPLGWVMIEIRDSGVGIPAENLPHIFDRFYRVRNPETNKIQGLGLGLSFVAWIVDAHGGRIDVSSTPGEGTVFTVHLPSDGWTARTTPSPTAALADSMKR
jgi:heavy metal sensor kinase